MHKSRGIWEQNAGNEHRLDPSPRLTRPSSLSSPPGHCRRRSSLYSQAITQRRPTQNLLNQTPFYNRLDGDLMASNHSEKIYTKPFSLTPLHLLTKRETSNGGLVVYLQPLDLFRLKRSKGGTLYRRAIVVQVSFAFTRCCGHKQPLSIGLD